MDPRSEAKTVVEVEPAGAERVPVHTALERFEARGPFLYRGAEKFCAKGVTYGPFRPNAAGESFPAASRVRSDFSLMRSLGVNAARLYDVPPLWLADLAAHSGISLLVGIPWAEHVCALREAAFRREVRERVRRAVALLRDHPAVLGVLVGNEIPSSNVRWTGPRAVERFLRDLFETAKSADPRRLVSYANYPPTEYLRLEAFDFYTLNVYLHDREPFSRYLAHVRNLAGDRPFFLGEFGIDVQREGEERQADILKFTLEESFRAGAAGTFIFSFTDEWFRGGNDVTGWSFGLTDRERRRRPAARTVAEVLARAPEVPLARTPRVSVVVATYNGGRTLRETLESLGKLRYPDYEVVVVDDGSTDDSAAIAREFLRPGGEGNGSVRLVQQENRGLSNARNTGIQAATGEIVAFCDSDVAVNRRWLYHLVAALLSGGPGTEGVGGPNLPPPGDGWVAAAVSASPGTATHVLMGDEAEHVPGCNMAFWKSALVALGGFDPRFRAAGDDVDICWRIQNAGGRLAFAPSAIVWHHRRDSARGYLRQQRGYGEAEADLAAKHPDRYNWLGGALWRGRIYLYNNGRGLLRLRRPRIQYGVFGLGLFQRLYEPDGPRLATVAAMPEAALAGLLALAGGILGRSILLVLPGAALLGAALAVALARALGAKLAPEDAAPKTRALVFWLSLAQPWVRRVAQLRKAHRLYRARRKKDAATPQERGGTDFAFWSESGGERMAFLEALERGLSLQGFPVLRGCPFDRFDLRVSGAPGIRALVSTVVEYHGGPKRLLRLRIRPVVSRGGLAALGFGICAAAVLGAASLFAAGAAGLLLALSFAAFRRRALWLRRVVLARAAEAAGESGFAPVRRAPSERAVPFELKPLALSSGPEDLRSADGG
jgi:GT2 family glycosyltransferase